MKKFWLAMLCTAGAYALWRYVEYRRTNNYISVDETSNEEEDRDDLSDINSVRSDYDTNGTGSDYSNRVLYSHGDSNNAHSTATVDYDRYYIPAGAIGPMTYSHDEAENERRRAEYEETGTCEGQDGESDLEHITSGDPNIDSKLSFISRRFDLKMWLIMSELCKMEFIPVLHQAHKEQRILSDIRYEYQKKSDEPLSDDFYGTYGDIFLWLADLISTELDCTKALALDDMFRYGKFYDAVYIVHDKKEARVDKAILEARADTFSMSDYDCKSLPYSIFGNDVLAEVCEYDDMYSDWYTQANLYIESKLDPEDEYRKLEPDSEVGF